MLMGRPLENATENNVLGMRGGHGATVQDADEPIPQAGGGAGGTAADETLKEQLVRDLLQSGAEAGYKNIGENEAGGVTVYQKLYEGFKVGCWLWQDAFVRNEASMSHAGNR